MRRVCVHSCSLSKLRTLLGRNGQNSQVSSLWRHSWDDLQIVSVVDNASELQREVAIANMPENLRDEMREKLPKAIEIVENPSASQLFACIRIAAIDDVVHLERLAGALRGKESL